MYNRECVLLLNDYKLTGVVKITIWLRLHSFAAHSISYKNEQGDEFFSTEWNPCLRSCYSRSLWYQERAHNSLLNSNIDFYQIFLKIYNNMGPFQNRFHELIKASHAFLIIKLKKMQNSFAPSQHSAKLIDYQIVVGNSLVKQWPSSVAT